jgi:hypothetical protein
MRAIEKEMEPAAGQRAILLKRLRHHDKEIQCYTVRNVVGIYLSEINERFHNINTPSRCYCRIVNFVALFYSTLWPSQSETEIGTAIHSHPTLQGKQTAAADFKGEPSNITIRNSCCRRPTKLPLLLLGSCIDRNAIECGENLLLLLEAAAACCRL